MKINILFLTIHILLFSLLSCSNDKDKEMVVPDGELYVIMNLYTLDGDIPTSNILFSIDDIKSFDTTTNEIIFYDLTVEELYKRIYEDDYHSLTLYIGKVPILDSINIRTVYSSDIYNSLAFVVLQDGCYLLDGYPSVDVTGDKKEEYQKIREENALKIKDKWKVFIKYMENRGKIVK